MIGKKDRLGLKIVSYPIWHACVHFLSLYYLIINTVVFSYRADLLFCVRLQLTGWTLWSQVLIKRTWSSCMWKGLDYIFMLQQVTVGKSICAHQELSANLTSVTSKRILLLRCINIFFNNTHFVEVCIVVLATGTKKFHENVSLVFCWKFNRCCHWISVQKAKTVLCFQACSNVSSKKNYYNMCAMLA